MGGTPSLKAWQDGGDRQEAPLCGPLAAAGVRPYLPPRKEQFQLRGHPAGSEWGPVLQKVDLVPRQKPRAPLAEPPWVSQAHPAPVDEPYEGGHTRAGTLSLCAPPLCVRSASPLCVPRTLLSSIEINRPGRGCKYWKTSVPSPTAPGSEQKQGPILSHQKTLTSRMKFSKFLLPIKQMPML